MATAGGGGHVVICDAEDDADLDAIVAAGARLDSGVVWAGAAGLAAALARTLPSVARSTSPAAAQTATARHGTRAERDERFVAVVGSTAGPARAQAEALVAAGAALVEIPGTLLEAADPTILGTLGADVAARCRRRSTVVVVSGDVHPSAAVLVGRSLAQVTAPAAIEAPTLVLTGGATARAVLEACALSSLELLAELEPGVVLARPTGPSSARIITKAGAFGDDRTLVRAIQRVVDTEGCPQRGSR
jgi:4-hydroxythreonine-4-phosphate dehydrogenase